jgi:hypothetical protein
VSARSISPAAVNQQAQAMSGALRRWAAPVRSRGADERSRQASINCYRIHSSHSWIVSVIGRP